MKHFYTRRGKNKSSKKAPLFLLPFCFRRARDFLLLFRGKAALVFFSLSCLSLHPSSRVFFKKVAENRSVGCFFHSRNQERFPPQNHSQNDQLYISLYSFTHNKYYNDAYHSSVAEARKRKRECLLLLLLYLSRSCCCCLNAKERAKFLSFKSEIHRHLSVDCG